MIYNLILLCCLGSGAIAANNHLSNTAVPWSHLLSSANANNQNRARTLSPRPQNAPYQKDFFYFSAPTEQPHHRNIKQFQQPNRNELRNRLQVLFIRMPERQGYENAVLQMAKYAVAQTPQTHIYVMHKQPDISGLVQKFKAMQAAANAARRPEVHFVKYRNEADAVRAQQQIRQQYNAPGANSRYTTQGGVAPVLNFVTMSINRLPSLPSGNGQTNPNRSYFMPSTAHLFDAPPVPKNYAMNFLPSGVDVVPGSSYVPLKKIKKLKK